MQDADKDTAGKQGDAISCQTGTHRTEKRYQGSNEAKRVAAD